MSVPVLILSAGASIGLGAVAAPFIGGALSVPITGATVPTRITDLAGYLTSSSRGLGKQGKARGLEDPNLQQSTIDDVGEDPNAQQSVGTPTSPPVSNPAGTTSTAKAPSGAHAPSQSGPTSDSKRMLAVVSFGAAIAITGASFFLLRRVLG